MSEDSNYICVSAISNFINCYEFDENTDDNEYNDDFHFHAWKPRGQRLDIGNDDFRNSNYGALM